MTGAHSDKTVKSAGAMVNAFPLAPFALLRGCLLCEYDVARDFVRSRQAESDREASPSGEVQAQRWMLWAGLRYVRYN